MKTFKEFVVEQFAGSNDYDDAISSLNDYADDGKYDIIIENFNQAALLWALQGPKDEITLKLLDNLSTDKEFIDENDEEEVLSWKQAHDNWTLVSQSPGEFDLDHQWKETIYILQNNNSKKYYRAVRYSPGNGSGDEINNFIQEVFPFPQIRTVYYNNEEASS